MAIIGGIYCGGSEGHPQSGIIYNSGVCFSLKNKNELDKIEIYDNGRWEVEIKNGQSSIVARCKDQISIDELLFSGFEYCQKLLDIISIDEKFNISIKSPSKSYYLIFKNKDQFIIRINGSSTVEITSKVNIIVKDKDGVVVPSPPREKVIWTPSFRYYRLSQLSQDIFEAYRNLFLAFEYALNDICPKKNNEGESDWILRALNHINQSQPLTIWVPSQSNDPVAYFVGYHYEHIRCKLFHAKGAKKILPHENPNLNTISEAYTNVLNIFRQIAIRYYNVSPEASAFTNNGFVTLMKENFQNNFSILITDDPTPPKIEDTNICQTNYSIFKCNEYNIEEDLINGRVVLSGATYIEEKNKNKLIHKYGITARNTLFCVGFIEEGLSPIGIDKIEIVESLGYINGSMPKLNF